MSTLNCSSDSKIKIKIVATAARNYAIMVMTIQPVKYKAALSLWYDSCYANSFANIMPLPQPKFLKSNFELAMVTKRTGARIPSVHFLGGSCNIQPTIWSFVHMVNNLLEIFMKVPKLRIVEMNDFTNWVEFLFQCDRIDEMWNYFLSLIT